MLSDRPTAYVHEFDIYRGGGGELVKQCSDIICEKESIVVCIVKSKICHVHNRHHLPDAHSQQQTREPSQRKMYCTYTQRHTQTH